jgi:hypothetical protein
MSCIANRRAILATFGSDIDILSFDLRVGLGLLGRGG